VQRARLIIEKCVHPDYKAAMSDYLSARCAMHRASTSGDPARHQRYLDGLHAGDSAAP
jgi:acyl-CoA hydrolase